MCWSPGCETEPTCQCGYQGKPRIFRGVAVIDAINHCQEFGLTPVGAVFEQRINVL